MGFNTFRNFVRWTLLAALATNFSLLFPVASPAQTTQQKSPSLETTFTRKDIAHNILAEGTPLEKKSERIIDLKAEYNPDEKEVTIGIYTPGWNKTIENYKGTREILDKNYMNVRPSKFYLFLQRDNTEFLDIDEMGYFLKLEDQRVFGEWERLIPADKSPYQRVLDLVKGKALVEILPSVARTTLKETFGFKESLNDLSLNDLAEKLGKQYEVREIEVYIPEGLEATVNSATKIIIQLNTAPEKTQNWLLLYKISLGNNLIGMYYCNGRFPFKIQGSLERKVAEENIDERILQTIDNEDYKSKYATYLKIIPSELKKYLSFKEELARNSMLGGMDYKIEMPSGLGNGFEWIDLFYYNINNAKDNTAISIVRLETEAELKHLYFQTEFYYDMSGDGPSGFPIYINRQDNVIFVVKNKESTFLSQKQIQRLGLEKYSPKEER